MADQSLQHSIRSRASRPPGENMDVLFVRRSHFAEETLPFVFEKFPGQTPSEVGVLAT